VGHDPLPDSLTHNRKALEAIGRFAHEQKILPRTVKPEEMFAANTVDLAYFVNQTMTTKELEGSMSSAQRGRPYGTESW